MTNGVYQTGGRVVYGTMNRVAVEKPLALESVNGPQFTLLNGSQVVRCAYLTNGATLSGFTLTDGLAQRGGGVFCESESGVLSNCILTNNSADLAYSGGDGGGAYRGTLNNCTLTSNSANVYCDLGGCSAGRGGGAFAATLNNCILTNNSATYGGGAGNSTLNNCTLTGNSAGNGGGAYSGTLNHCTLSGNSAYYGGGAYLGTLNNCALSGNTADDGGGADSATLNNCIVAGNSANNNGGGASGGTLNNCTLTGNSAYSGGGASQAMLNNCTLTSNSTTAFAGGASGGTLNNCIAYFNTAPTGANYDDFSTLNYSCTTPLPASGTGNISVDPQLASVSRLSALSPCIGKGNSNTVSGVDIDGELWANPPSMGCDEYHAGAVTGPLTVAITATFTNVAVGYPVGLTALIEGRTDLSAWVFGDGALEINQPYVAHAWTAPGDYLVALWCFNDSHPEGVSATLTVHVLAQPVHYVAANSSNPVSPYTSWATAATNIQDAVDAAYAGGTVLVTNGIYATGGRAVDGTMTNRVTVLRPCTVRSVKGPERTFINGDDAVRCVYLPNGGSLVGFTLSHGALLGDLNGGGVWCESTSAIVSNCVLIGNSAGYGGGAHGGTLNNCTLTGNSATHGGGASASTLNNCALSGNSAEYGGGTAGDDYPNQSTLNNCTLTGNTACYGGGAYRGTLNNCTLAGNTAYYGGGGASGCTLNNCTLTGNTPTFSGGGGASWSTLNGCIVYFNTGWNYADYSILNYCCTTPLPTNGVGNFTNAPLFLNQAGGNLRLQSNSPCINAGNNANVAGITDLDGRPRIVSGTVDIGAYEFQPGISGAFISWLQQFGLPTDGSADATDADTDGMDNWQEWIAGTNPTNALSQLRLLAPVFTPPGLRLRWNSNTNHAYSVERTPSLKSPLTFSLLRSNVPGLPGTTTFIDTTAPAIGAGFYRIGTDSTNDASPLWLHPPLFVPASVVVSWSSLTNRSYFLERSSSLATPMVFAPLATNLTGLPGTTTYADTNAVGPGPFFYRVGVQP